MEKTKFNLDEADAYFLQQTGKDNALSFYIEQGFLKCYKQLNIFGGYELFNPAKAKPDEILLYRLQNHKADYRYLIYREDLDAFVDWMTGGGRPQEPIPVKGRPQTMQYWIQWRMQQDGVCLDDLPHGYQQKLIREAQQYGFDEQGTAVKRAFKALKT